MRFSVVFRGCVYRWANVFEPNCTNASRFNFGAIIGVLENNTPKKDKYIEARNTLLNNVKIFYKGWKKIIEGFKKRISPFNYDEAYEEQS